MSDPYDVTRPLSRPRHPAPQNAEPPAAASQAPEQGRRIFREEAVRGRAAGREPVRAPLVIGGPSFLVLWLIVMAILAAAVVLAVLTLRAAGAAA
ncbi:hypothetical protein [Nonomuraea sp. NPDC050783]|uniref:hypothetical protein n=1 Tax=Nonomuraea sp. NPDC050783 TaxID=3154634 RepID=UPI003467B682